MTGTDVEVPLYSTSSDQLLLLLSLQNWRENFEIGSSGSKFGPEFIHFIVFNFIVFRTQHRDERQRRQLRPPPPPPAAGPAAAPRPEPDDGGRQGRRWPDPG